MVRISQRADEKQVTSFPPLPTSQTQPCATACATHHFDCNTATGREPSVAISCRAALAVLLSRYTRAVDIAFNIVTAEAPSHSEQRSLSHNTASLSLCYVHVDPQQPRSNFIRDMEEQVSGLSEAGIFERVTQNPNIVAQTVLAIARSVDEQRRSSYPPATMPCRLLSPYTDRALLLECQLSNESISILAQYDPNVMDGVQIRRFLRQFGHLIEQFQNNMADVPVQELDAMTREDRQEIQTWNCIQPPIGKESIQDAIMKWCHSQPMRPAIFAWDGSVTYAELDSLSSRLARHLLRLNLGVEVVIPLCFEKSKWTVISMLAVLKAGAAFTLVDPSLPSSRIESICKQVSAQVALVHTSQQHRMSFVISRCITVDDTLLDSLSTEEDALPHSRPQDLAYIIFTSGSTGDPKGSMIEHRGITTYASAFGPAFKLDQNSRTLQFASYAYAVCLAEMFGTLLTGGCLCIPSADDRENNIASFIQESEATMAIFTPSFVRAIKPDAVPSLKVLMLAGEPMTPETLDTWAKHVHVLNGCGQSECLLTSIAEINADIRDVRFIGHGSGTRLWITETGNCDRLAPVGCTGELLIEGCGVGRGYLNLPELTASKFLTKAPAWYPQGCEPLEAARFYRTGDLACYRPDGGVLNLGREDTQVKIRGQRIELGDVEFHLRKIVPENITPIVGIVDRTHANHREILVAFLVGTLDKVHTEQQSDFEPFILDHADASRFTAKLEDDIVRHAIPSCFVSLKEAPKTATGKTDRRSLQAIATELLDARDQVVASRPSEPRASDGPEAALARLWGRSMSIDANSINIHDNFFDLGGDSIVAVQLVNKARAAGIPLKVEDVLRNPVFDDLVAVTEGEPTAPTEEEQRISLLSRDSNEAELSFAQRGLWFLEQLNPGTSAYNVSIAGRLRGPLRIDALRAALQALEDRHETLRTTFKERDGIPVQVIQDCRSMQDTLKLIEIALGTDFSTDLHRHQSTAFELQSSPPWRVAVLRLSEEDHIVSIVMHHIISDGWSDDILRRDLASFYTAAVAGRDPRKELEPLAIQYRDFAAWQQNLSQQAELQRQLQYWTEQLADSTPAELLLDKRRPALPSGGAGVIGTTIDKTLFQTLRQFCKTQQTTPFVVLLAAFRTTHFRLTGQDDATIGSPNASRNRNELEGLVGFFSNTQCMRITIDHDDTFEQLVRKTKAVVTAALAYQDVPFELVVSEAFPGARDASRNPLVQLMFAVHSQPSLGEIHLEGTSGEALPGTESTRFDLEFHLVQREEEIRGNVLFAKELFEPETIHAMIKTFQEVLRRGLEKPDTSIVSMPIVDGLPDLRSKGLLDLALTHYSRDSSVIDIFSEQVTAYPSMIAVKDSSTQLTYDDLNVQSEIVAAWLRGRGFSPETWIGVLANRSCQTIIVFLAILKANLAYVPLDVDAPLSRMEDIISSFKSHKLILLGNDIQNPGFTTKGVEIIRVSEILEHGMVETHPISHSLPSATSLAYVMFTSGSTGKPKGVMIEHRGIVRLVKQSNVLSQLPSTSIVAHLFNLSFDLSVWEMYTALLNGGTLICIDAATKLDVKALEETFKRESVQAAMMPPVLLKACLSSAPSLLKGLAAFYNGADRFDSHDAMFARQLVPGRVVNAYGPTENSALSTIYDVLKDDCFTNGVPIGNAVSNSGAYIMDKNQHMVSMGVIGELVVVGDGVARGYTDSALDRDTFIEITIDDRKVKAYRTGDRVRCRPRDGQIEFFGRLDRQVKIRGFRIEMAEVEHAMLNQDEVNDAAVVIHQRDEEDPGLIGFVTVQGGDAAGKEEDISHQVESWSQQFDNNFYEGIESIDNSLLGSDFLGWTSMYDGKKIDRSEMEEWLNDTMKTMLDEQAAGRVLEIGTGTGMVLMNLGEGLENYVGIDPSKPAVTFATDQVKQRPTLADKVQVHVGAATDITCIDTRDSQLVVLNSVVQYFPSPDYLFEVVDAIAQLPHTRRIFFGDVRSFALNRQFLASRALYKLGNNATKVDVRQEMARMEEREEELLVSPAFFTGLQDRMKDVVEHVEILPKRMKATNELSSYRYAAVVYLKRSNRQALRIKTIDDHDWVDFRAHKLSHDTLVQLLEDSQHNDTIAISNIPYSKTVLERYIVEALDDEDYNLDSSEEGSWLSDAKEAAKKCSALSPKDIIDLGKQKGFDVELSWSRQFSQNGGIDAIFFRKQSPLDSGRTKFIFPSDKSSSRPELLSNRPLQGLRNVQVEKRVRNALQAQLPSYMIPGKLVVLEHMPTNPNGKVDRKQLAKLAKSTHVYKTTTTRVRPRNNEERALCEEFSNVLGADVNATDDFFGLGGHSLMAMRLLPRVKSRLGWHILLRDLYKNSTPRALYEAQTTASNGSCRSEWPSFMERHSSKGKCRATLVLLHGFWGQGRIFSGLVPLLNDQLEIIILHDPFFGKSEGPRSLDAWAKFYLEKLRERLPRDAQVLLGGYSFGGLTILKMASLWRDWFDVDLLSMIPLDPAVYEPVYVDKLSEEFLREKFDYGLRLFGQEQKDFVEEHFKKFGPLMASPKDQPVYNGRGLHIASSEVAGMERGVVQWWAANYPSLEQQCFESTHHGLFESENVMKQVGQAIKEHAARIWSEAEV